MAIATRLQEYMSEHDLHYDVLTHPHSHHSMETAQLARVPGNSLAKSVLLADEDGGFIMAILPSTHHVNLRALSRTLGCGLRLAGEDEIARLFPDCEPGAIPPFGMAYGMPMVIDDSLGAQDEIYFEAGDHEKLIQMSRRDFMQLMQNAEHVRFSEHHWRH